jgi:hypothetical protein
MLRTGAMSRERTWERAAHLDASARSRVSPGGGGDSSQPEDRRADIQGVDGRPPVPAAEMQVGRDYRWNDLVFTVISMEFDVTAPRLIGVSTYAYGLLKIHEDDWVWPQA